MTLDESRKDEIIADLRSQLNRAAENGTAGRLQKCTDFKEREEVHDDEDTLTKIATAFQFGMALGFAKKCDEMCEKEKKMDKNCNEDLINFRCDEEMFKKIVKAMKAGKEKELWAVVTSESGKQGQKIFILFDDCYKAKEYVDALCTSEMSEDLGYWLIVSNEFRACSECGATVPFDSDGKEIIPSNYCPGCGSKMMRIDKL